MTTYRSTEFATGPAAEAALLAANSAVQPGTSPELTGGKFGSATDYAEFEADGFLKFVGTGGYWDDITSGIAAAKTSGPGVTFNTTELTLDFVATADLNDFGILPFQLEHRREVGSSLRLHLHWEQTLAGSPNWLFEYRWQRQGNDKTTAWTRLTSIGQAFTYVSGTLNQISYSALIAEPEGASMSDILQVRLIRDSGNTSALFAGADTYAATAAVTSFDPHVKFDTLGSREEFTK